MTHYRLVTEQEFAREVAVPMLVGGVIRSTAVTSIVTIYLDDACAEIGRSVVIPASESHPQERLHYLKTPTYDEPVIGPLFLELG